MMEIATTVTTTPVPHLMNQKTNSGPSRTL